MVFKKKAFLILFAACSLGAGFSAENVRSLTVDDAVILAADNNVMLKRQRISLDLLEKKNKTSWNSVSPSVSADGSYTLPVENPDNYSISLSASLSLRLAPSLYTSIKTAALNYENGKITYEDYVRQIELSVRKSFYSLILSKSNIAQQERDIESAAQRYRSSREKYNRGQLSEIDLLSAQYSYESQLPTLEASKNNYENTMATFKQTLGLSQEEELELVGSLEDFLNIGEISVDAVIDELPSIKKIKASIESARLSLLATRFSAWGPAVSLSYRYGISSSSQMGERGWSVPSQNSLSVGVSIPLDGYLPWSSGAMSIESQKASLEDLELQLESQRTTAELEIQSSVKRINQARLQEHSLQANVNLAQKTYDMTQDAYNHGSKDLLALQNASNSLMNARNSLLTQTYNLVSAILDLEYTLGIPFGTLGE